MLKAVIWLTDKVRWHLNEWALGRLGLLNKVRGWLTVQDAFGAPGDALLAATACRILKSRFPSLRINLRTSWPDLVHLDPCLSAINARETYFTLRFWYLETVARKECEHNVLLETLLKVGISEYPYHARVYLTEDEKEVASNQMGLAQGCGRPRLAFCSLSKEKVKNWPQDRWELLLSRLSRDFDLVHLGDEREPEFAGVKRLAGRLSMRESMAALFHCHVFVGPDSFLMHAANGLRVPSVIIFGGSRPPACLGYASNANLYIPMPCGPCWLHDSRGDVCPHNIACMDRIRVEDVEAAISDVLAQRTRSMRIRDSLVDGG